MLISFIAAGELEYYSQVMASSVFTNFVPLQLIRECKEVLLGAVTVKQYYQQMVGAVVSDEDGDKCEMDLEQFEEDMRRMMEVCTINILLLG